jgi:O-antigen ligase
MARFDGARQGIGVWLWTILAAIIVAAVAAIGGTGYDIYERLNLPRIAVGGSTLTAGGAIAGAAAIVVTLLFAVIGGKVGERYHRRVDRVATDEYVVE